MKADELKMLTKQQNDLFKKIKRISRLPRAKRVQTDINRFHKVAQYEIEILSLQIQKQIIESMPDNCFELGGSVNEKGNEMILPEIKGIFSHIQPKPVK